MGDTHDKPASTYLTTDLSGRQLGDLQVIRRLGRGAMAEVYLAYQPRLQRQVAVKVLKPELARDQAYLKRFQREARAAASLVHACIVQIYHVGFDDELHYIVQEYVQGHNLLGWIARHGAPDFAHAMAIIRQMAAALAKAGEQGVVHRDIKPENILITEAGEVKIADFGLARCAQETGATELTQIGMTMGTPLYMSPEQVEGRPLDPRSDLYSFGVTCYHLLAGEPPFQAETALGVAVQHIKSQPKPLESVRPDLPPALCRLVHKLLSKDRQRRCQSAGEVLGELYRIHQNHAADGPSSDPTGWETMPPLPGSAHDPQLTGRLSQLMQRVDTQPSARQTALMTAGAMAVAFLTGALIAWFATAEPPLLAAASTAAPSTPRQETALGQYLLASRIGTEAAWQSVIHYYPDNEQLTRRARQQLARLYFREGDHDRAMTLFSEFAALDDPSDRSLRAWGLAGQYGLLTLQGRSDEAAEILNALWPIREALRDPAMRRVLHYAVKKNHAQLLPDTADQWDRWLAEQFSDDG